MASDDEAGPSNKRLKLDPTEPIMDVRDTNKLFPKIDNLEHFPLKVLMKIFEYVDYMDLYNLAEKSVRFEKIAKIVLNEKYTHKYFMVDTDKQKKETFIDFFQRFGSEIKSLCVNGIMCYENDENHWITTVLDKAINLKKLDFCNCQIQLNRNWLQRHVNENITHLSLYHFNGYYTDFVLSKFHNLKELVIENELFDYDHSFGPSANVFKTLEEVARNNPALESLIIDDKIDVKLYPFDRLMKLIGTNLKQLKEFAYVTEDPSDSSSILQLNRQPDNIVDSFVKSLKHLESLALSKSIHTFTDFMALLVRLNSQCPNIKHLKLYDLDSEDTKLIKFIKSFEHLESLKLSFTDSDCQDEIESLVEHLPFLRKFEFEVLNDAVDWKFILVLLRKCPSLQTFNIHSKASELSDLEMFGTGEFFNKFTESIQNRNVKIQIEGNYNDMGSVSKDEVTWREKLLYWKTGRDPSKNLSTKHLLDLNEQQPNAVSNIVQRNPFNLMLGYLDLKSLYALSNASKRTSQLVSKYMEQHSQQNGVFAITNEFSNLENTYYDGLEMFADYVVNLRVNIIHGNADGLRELIEKFYKLNKLWVYSTSEMIDARDLIVPQVRHLISRNDNSDYYDLYELSRVCPELETFETDHIIHTGGPNVKSLHFRKLKKITLYGSTDTKALKKLKALVKHMGTKIVNKTDNS